MMCGRFSHRLPWREIHRLYSLNTKDESRNTEARYNIAPTQDVLFVRLDSNGQQIVQEGRWSLVPAWMKELPKVPLFNARAKTVAEKPAFRDSFRHRRCLIPADGFFEWEKNEDGSRDPWFFHLPEDHPFSFAGLWARNGAHQITSCTILTTAAVEPVSAIHDRMPVILDQSAYDDWLRPETPSQGVLNAMRKVIDDQLVQYRVDRQVNSSRFEGADAIRPLQIKGFCRTF